MYYPLEIRRLPTKQKMKEFNLNVVLPEKLYFLMHLAFLTFMKLGYG